MLTEEGLGNSHCEHLLKPQRAGTYRSVPLGWALCEGLCEHLLINPLYNLRRMVLSSFKDEEMRVRVK